MAERTDDGNRAYRPDRTGAIAQRAPTDDTGEKMLTGNCERCTWYVVKDSYPEIVKAYQQHLRGEHPQLWLRR